MSALNVILSPTAKVRINGTRCGVVRGSLTFTTDDPETTDTEQSPRKSFKLGNYMVEGTLTLFRQSDLPPHATGVGTALGILPATAVQLEIAPGGSFTAGNYYDIPVFNVERFTESFSVQGSEPQGFEIQGKGSGTTAFTLPTSV
jgi:hypothetical protein